MRNYIMHSVSHHHRLYFAMWSPCCHESASQSVLRLCCSVTIRSTDFKLHVIHEEILKNILYLKQTKWFLFLLLWLSSHEATQPTNQPFFWMGELLIDVMMMTSSEFFHPYGRDLFSRPGAQHICEYLHNCSTYRLLFSVSVSDLRGKTEKWQALTEVFRCYKCLRSVVQSY